MGFNKGRYAISLFIGKGTVQALRFFKRGGTALPGFLAERIYDNFLKYVSQYIKNSILISGTNGKTTTARLLVNMLKKGNMKVINNLAGSNLKRGIISTIIPYLTLGGFKSDVDYAVFECDEFALDTIVKDIRPKVLILNNLFRDQLDRYGEIETVRKRWINFIKALDETTFIVNGDDPSLASIFYAEKKHHVLYFGLKSSEMDMSILNDDNLSDAVFCPICKNQLTYKHRFFSHLGDYECKYCGFRKPHLDIYIEVNKKPMNKKVVLFYEGRIFYVYLPMEGVYNAYNFLASLLSALYLGLNVDDALDSLENFTPAFGRGERIKYDNKTLIVTLVKNPVGFSEAIKTHCTYGKIYNIVFILNDNIADGRDVSWIWDVSFSSLNDNVENIIVAGSRLYDMALRIKYEGIRGLVSIQFAYSMDELFKKISYLDNEYVYVFLTYTALIKFKKYIMRPKGKYFWE